MALISDEVETSIQEQLPRSTTITIPGGILYTNIHFVRYVQGDKHLTGDCFYRLIGDPWHWMPWLLRELLQPKEFILRFDAPVCWDNQTNPIAVHELEQILLRVTSALRKKYKRFKIEFQEPGSR